MLDCSGDDTVDQRLSVILILVYEHWLWSVDSRGHRHIRLESMDPIYRAPTSLPSLNPITIVSTQRHTRAANDYRQQHHSTNHDNWRCGVFSVITAFITVVSVCAKAVVLGVGVVAAHLGAAVVVTTHLVCGAGGHVAEALGFDVFHSFFKYFLRILN